jgi:hypothetical protein
LPFVAHDMLRDGKVWEKTPYHTPRPLVRPGFGINGATEGEFFPVCGAFEQDFKRREGVGFA